MRKSIVHDAKLVRLEGESRLSIASRIRSGKGSALLWGTALLALGGFALWPYFSGAEAADGLVHDGEIGFVLTEFAYVLGPDPAQLARPRTRGRGLCCDICFHAVY